MQITFCKYVKHVKDRKKNLAFSIYSLVSIDKGSVSTKLFTLNEYEPCTQRRLSSGRLSGVKLKPACPATGANKSSEISRLARLARANNEGADKTVFGCEAVMRLCFSHFSHEQAYFSLHATQILAYEPL